uniref:PPM-type phosphatase domain-containing protein n=1 Tax=Mesocestoides corti TaxID=53468 RepID=A0A5K3FKR4_MESCO
MGQLYRKRHWQLSEDDKDSRSQLDLVHGAKPEDEDMFNSGGEAVYCSGVTDCSHIGVSPLVEGEKHAMVATSCDRGYDFRLCGVTRALNDAPGT